MQMAIADVPVGDAVTALGIVEWLNGDECHGLDDAGLGRRLRDAGLPLDRLTLHLRTLHPDFFGRIVAETLEPGSSVSIVARRHGVNADQILLWRRELGPKPAAAVENGTMLPVEIMPEPRPRRRADVGCVGIEFGSSPRVRVRSEVPLKMLRQVIDSLRYRLAAEARIWLAAGRTVMRKGFAAYAYGAGRDGPAEVFSWPVIGFLHQRLMSSCVTALRLRHFAWRK